MKNNLKNLANRYKYADTYLFKNLPTWKQKIIIECRKLNKQDRILDEFVKEIIKLAESEEILIDKKLNVKRSSKKVSIH